MPKKSTASTPLRHAAPAKSARASKKSASPKAPRSDDSQTQFRAQSLTAEVEAPSFVKMALEARAPWEIGLGLLAMPFLALPQAPRGDGHAVLVFPGLAANDATTALLRRFLDGAGFDARGWDLGFNTGPTAERMEACRTQVRELHQATGRTVSLVGWSLGGLYAREIAKELPKLVRCVVTLGSPFAASPKATNAGIVYQLLAGHDAAQAAHGKNLDVAPPVPTTSIYSKTDGIVAWQCSVQGDPSIDRKRYANPQTENIEVQASHLGIGANPLALYALADRLSQPEGEWQPFDKSGIKRWLYRERSPGFDFL